jgi:hypothetical protein
MPASLSASNVDLLEPGLSQTVYKNAAVVPNFFTAAVNVEGWDTARH